MSNHERGRNPDVDPTRAEQRADPMPRPDPAPRIGKVAVRGAERAERQERVARGAGKVAVDRTAREGRVAREAGRLAVERDSERPRDER